jgi:hypothetical protein
MRTYTELINEFAVKNAFTKQEMIDETSNEEFLNAASIEELKILRDGLGTFYEGSWLDYIKIVISKKIEEERERKLNELGI